MLERSFFLRTFFHPLIPVGHFFMHISLAAETLFYLGKFPVTNAILTSWLVTGVLILVAFLVGKTFKKHPSGVQQLLEMVYAEIESLAVGIAGEKGKKYTPLAVTLFLYILLSNWLGLVPGVGSVGLEIKEHGEAFFVPFIRSATADLNTTLALALVSVVVAQVLGLRSSGIRGHLKHFINPLEIISEFSKILSFSFRLFGNVFAGEVLLGAAASIFILVSGANNAWFGIPGGIIQIPFVALEILVGLIQAFIFSALTLVFISVFTFEHESLGKEAH